MAKFDDLLEDGWQPNDALPVLPLKPLPSASAIRLLGHITTLLMVVAFAALGLVFAAHFIGGTSPRYLAAEGWENPMEKWSFIVCMVSGLLFLGAYYMWRPKRQVYLDALLRAQATRREEDSLSKIR